VPAITTDHPFLRKHAHRIQGVLSCFDRVIFRGYLPCSHPRGLEGFLAQQNVLLKDFKHYAPKIAERLKEHVRTLVSQAGGTFRHLPRKERMEEEARQLAQQRGLREGIICGFSCLETCATFRLQYAQGRPRLKAGLPALHRAVRVLAARLARTDPRQAGDLVPLDHAGVCQRA
jgi:hypothetical protein